MSRIGKQPIEISSEVNVKIDKGLISIKGPKGELSWSIPKGVKVKQEKDNLIIEVESMTKRLRSLWGTARAVIANMVEGVKNGFEKKLQIEGVGYKAQVQGDKLVLNLGFSHPVEIKTPGDVSFSVDKNIITVSGIDKVVVGETAAKIRSLRKPEPYKGKGIRYVGEEVRRKAGKKVVGADGPGA